MQRTGVWQTNRLGKLWRDPSPHFMEASNTSNERTSAKDTSPWLLVPTKQNQIYPCLCVLVCVGLVVTGEVVDTNTVNDKRILLGIREISSPCFCEEGHVQDCTRCVIANHIGKLCTSVLRSQEALELAPAIGLHSHRMSAAKRQKQQSRKSTKYELHAQKSDDA